MKKTLLPLLLIAMIALVVAGCGDDDSSDTSTPAPAESTDTGSGGAEDTGGSGGTVAVEMSEYAFSPDPIEVKKGDTIELSNIGGVTHDLTVEDEGIEVDVAPGGSDEVAIDLKPGTYDAICDIGNHAELGMTTTLIVN